MRAVIQRSGKASVQVDDQTVGEIDRGLVILLGVKTGDTEADADYLADKIVNLRIFPDGEDKMNCSLLDTGGQALIISQFTLYADSRRGRRPCFIEAAPPAEAKQLYELFVEKVRSHGILVATGIFQAVMSVQLTNEGPVTLIVESKSEQS